MTQKHSDRLNGETDISNSFKLLESQYFQGQEAIQFDAESQSGKLQWVRANRKSRMAFNKIDYFFEPSQMWEFPPDYAQSPETPFKISFVSNNTVRIQIESRKIVKRSEELSEMLAQEPGSDQTWTSEKSETGWIWHNECGSVELQCHPFRIVFRDSKGKLLTQTYHHEDKPSLNNTYPIPVSFVRSAADMSHRLAASFALSPGEKIYGGGESFTALNKRGQKLRLFTRDPLSAQTQDMYKPIPFLMSNRGYGMFVHSSAPMTFDIGQDYDAANVLYIDDDSLDLFFFFGEPKELLYSYTSLTGRSPLPPLWSFGLWMSRITYNSEEQVREVASRMREEKIPCDVIHIDTGWFEQDWRCDYRFAPSRFTDAKKMIDDLREDGYRVSLWQVPYFTPENPLFEELLEKGLVITDTEGNLPTEDAILDFSNPDAVKWYQDQIESLLEMGVAAIKADFGESAPVYGRYHSGKSGRFEHNLYPLRYNKTVADITKKVTGDHIIFARSAWAGSQRYPMHWGGDAENTDSAMHASLRAGLSIGLSGFTYWSHDIGGFVKKSPEALYRRWLPFGMLTSHSRVHGAPPKEPWAYSDHFVEQFKAATDMKYRLMPYIYTQAYLASQQGLPMMRAMLVEYPKDQNCWLVDDQYLLGSDLLVAPLFEEFNEREVYLPEGVWYDYQTNKRYTGGQRVVIEAAEIPIIVLARGGAVIPQAAPAASTELIDWEAITGMAYRAENQSDTLNYEEEEMNRSGMFYHPLDKEMTKVKSITVIE